MSVDRTTLRPSAFASWVHVLASDDDRGVRPLPSFSIELKYTYNIEKTHLSFEVANSGVCDAYPAMIDWLFCIGFNGPHGHEHWEYDSGEKVVMLRGHSRYPIDIVIEGDVLQGRGAALGCFPLMFVRVADLGTPSPTRERLHELAQYRFDATAVLGRQHFFADLVGMPGFGCLTGTPFES